MDTNALVDLVHEVQGQIWVDKVNETHRLGRLCPWVSTFHPDKLPCELEGSFHHGAFNAGMKMVFSDRTVWMVRFPLRAWGPAATNPLGLGPFIIMDFIDGVSLGDLLQDHSAERPSRLMREDISDHDVEIIYRQMAGFLLQLFRLDFEQIGSLPPPPLTEAHRFTSLPRPLTFKVHSILQNGEVNTFGDRTKGFATTTEYFQYVVGQDWEQLVHQPNSVCGEYDAQNKYVAFKALRSFVPDLIHSKYNHGNFKLICDDLGLANLIVRSKDDLTVVGVVDLEWSYIGPAQLFGSAPWWLLQDRPVNSAWDYNGEEPPETAARPPGHEEKELSSLVKWSRESGAMWLHILLSSGFNDHRSFPFTKLRQHFGADGWAKREKEFDCAEELEAFALRKVGELDNGRMTKEEFILAAAAIIEPRSSLSSVVNDEASNEKVRKARPIS
ncbi:phosphotransferase enzyme family protein [Aspergillus piperis CBS 112811]|uniref:Phosphotransferase enzyme family protein n=1 Tax=Aspergillus piperis CBS 112811 TaxID=1448313 RepID=A0A8G1VUF6_9EURO|nr:phosphotransferase enzyme family protein [Aspergillus piperis CBS 112811]RAH62798.1 phosphotransferase enzyme family protein [Aspergillus piperis CBS 112811]